jgi:hypothetical protein
MLKYITATILASLATASAAAKAFDRFFIIVLENIDYAEAMADPYLGRTLPKKGRLFTNYAATSHPSQPNYLAMVILAVFLI